MSKIIYRVSSLLKQKPTGQSLSEADTGCVCKWADFSPAFENSCGILQF